MLRDRAIAFCRDTSGIILPYVTLLLTVLVGTSVLALDGARYMSLQSQLQNGADALALAGAAELDQHSDSITRSTNAINNLVTNSTLYAGNVQVSTIQFLSSLPASDHTAISGANVTTDPTLAKFVRVTVTPVTLPTILPASFFGGTNSVTAGAEAVAGFPNTVACNFPPIFICNPYETAGMSDDAATAAFRTAMNDPATLRKQFRMDSSKTGPGQFGFLIPPDGCTGAACLGDWIARTSPRACYSKGGVDLNTGMKTAVNDAFNVRFDIKKGSYSPGPGYAPATNVRKGHVWPGSGQKNWCNAVLWNSSQADSNCATNNAPGTHAMAPPLDNFSGTNIQSDGNWNCASYWTNSHTSAAPSGCTATNPTVSRYQVYQYEIDHNLIGESSPYTKTNCKNPETGNPLCAGTSNGVAMPDRRNIVVAVVNCLAQTAAGKMGGGSTANNVPAAAFAKYFITQPVGDDGTNNVYGEFTGYATKKDGIVMLDQVQLYR